MQIDVRSIGEHEEIYLSETTRVTRVPLPGGKTVIRKEPLGANAVLRLRHENRILGRLAGIRGVPRFAREQPADAIAFEDDCCVTLSTYLRSNRFSGSALLTFAYRLTAIVVAVHRAGVIHKDVNPANILICGPQREPVLIDYQFSTTSAEERPAFIHPNEIAGTLAYIAPELSGRVGKSVDQRADLYSLGIVFYELVTGRCPFVAGDALQLIHDHIAHVPEPPVTAGRQLPTAFSDIIMKLLEKEPDQRYQSGEGLLYDLAYLRRKHGSDAPAFTIAERDYPICLRAPSRLIGRETEIELLQIAFEAAAEKGGGLFVAGAAGVGKSALLNEVRPMVAQRAGWFVSGKFDQYRPDAVSGFVHQILGDLGRLLLAESEPELATFGECIISVLDGKNDMLAGAIPKFSALAAGITVAPSDSLGAEAGLRVAAIELLRSVAARRPLVLFIDDLQWADATALRFIDAIFADGKLNGLMIVGSYRELDVDPTHPLSLQMMRWRRLGVAPQILMLKELRVSDVGKLIETMMRLPPDAALRLASAVAPQTFGNPYDTIELLNALRREDILVSTEAGWAWDDTAIRCYVGNSSVSDLLGARIARLAPSTRELIETLACLGSEVALPILEAATTTSQPVLEEMLASALDDGLLIMRAPAKRRKRSSVVLFRHSRVREVAYDGLNRHRRETAHLTIARRLGGFDEYVMLAAEHYLQALHAIEEPDEREHAIVLFREAASRARLSTAFDTVERFCAAGLFLLDDTQSAGPARAALLLQQHEALCGLGRYDEADRAYAALVSAPPVPSSVARAACVQIRSLQSRSRFSEAVALACDVLETLGLARSERGTSAAIDLGLAALRTWFQNPQSNETSTDNLDPDHPLELAASVANAVLPAAMTCEPDVLAWLVIESGHLWRERGPSPALVANLSHAAAISISHGQDYRTGYTAAKYAIGAGERFGYEPETSVARSVFTSFSQHWFEPLEAVISETQRAREGLLRGGSSHVAGITYMISLAAIFDSATLEDCATELSIAVAYATKTGNAFANGHFLRFSEMIEALRGERDWRELTSRELPSALEHNIIGAGAFYFTNAILAAIFDDPAALTMQSSAAMRLVPLFAGGYRTTFTYLFRALALAEEARAIAGDDARRTILQAFDECRAWIAARAADAPMNFSHLAHLLDAERAWAGGDRFAAAIAYDKAILSVARRNRPWHRAIILERTSRFSFANELEGTGRDALVRARNVYEAWGATAKVSELERSNPFLTTAGRYVDAGARKKNTVSSESVDVEAILKASQALGSETSLDKLRQRVSEALAAISGATSVALVVSYGEQGWCLLPDGGSQEQAISIDSTEAAAQIPLSAFRYVRRTGEPLLVDDATRDGRFAGDPYFATLQHCSLLVLPIASQGELRAVLVLENRLRGDAFSADRVDTVALVAAQLAVSLDNALLYASLERKVAERTEALAAANLRLETLSTTDALTGMSNRRSFDTLLLNEWRRAHRAKGPLSLAMIDIDEFKKYNDRYGHVAGDDCLRRVGNAIDETVRLGSDFASRYGGEEFAIILPSTDITQAPLAAQRVRRSVAALHLPHVDSQAGIVTISIGVGSIVPATGQSTKTLIEKADEALYRAKRSGRNRVCAEEAPETPIARRRALSRNA